MNNLQKITKKDLETLEQRLLLKMLIINLLCIGFAVGIATFLVQ